MWKIASVFWFLVGFGVNDAYQVGRVWDIWTVTPIKEYGGTDAKVFIVLIDPNGRESQHMYLENYFLNDFEQGSVDHFSVDDWVKLKEVCAIRIYHDNGGTHPGWYLEKVTMKTAGMTKDRVFYCNCWVNSIEEERKSHRIIQRTPPCSDGPLE